MEPVNISIVKLYMTIVPVADTNFVAKSPTQEFSLVLVNTTPRWSGTMRWIGLVFGSSSQNKLETLCRSVGHGGHICTGVNKTALK